MVMRQIASGDDEVKCGAVMGAKSACRASFFSADARITLPRSWRCSTCPFVCCTYTNAYGTLDPSKYSSVSIADEQEAYRAVMELAKRATAASRR